MEKIYKNYSNNMKFYAKNKLIKCDKIDINNVQNILKEIGDNYEEIKKFVCERYINLNSRGTHENFISVGLREAYNFTKDEKYNNLHGEQIKAVKLGCYNKEQKKINDNEEKAEEQIKFIDFVEYYRKNIKDDATNMIKHYEFVLFSMIGLFCPSRPQIYESLKIVDEKTLYNEKNQFIGNDKEENYIYKCLSKNIYVVVINVDKVSNKLGSSNLSITNEELIKILDDSINRKKRLYLFENLNTSQPYNYMTFLRILLKHNFNFNTLRSSFITHTFDANKSYRERCKIGCCMRHSVITGIKFYNKFKGTQYISDEGYDIIMNEYIPKKDIDTEI